MAAPSVRPVVLWVLALGFVVSGLLATKVELDRRRLAAAYAKTQAALTQVEQERAHLSQELTQARQTLEDQSGELAQLQSTLEHTEESVAQLRLEQARLQSTNMSLTDQLTSATQARQALEAKLSSLKELKAAIRQVKHTLWQQSWQVWLDHVRMQQEADQQKLTQGNRGFVVRQGSSTLGSVTTLQVRVHEPQTQ